MVDLEKTRRGIRAGVLEKRNFLWVLIAAGFVFLTADEILKIHENLDRMIHRLFEMHETPFSDHLDDIIIGVYGIIGIVVLFMYRSEFMIFRGSLSYFIAGFALLFLMVVLDILGNRGEALRALTGVADVESIRVYVSAGEDIVKLLGGSVFLSAMYSVWSGLPNRSR